MENLLSLRTRAALLVGAASAVGSATAQLLAQAGASLALLDEDADATADLAEAIVAAGGDAIFIPGSPHDPLVPPRVVPEILRRFGGLHILALFETPPSAAQDWVGAAVTPLGESGCGRILCLCPMTGRPDAADRAANGGALIALGRSWARELGARHITCNVVLPGLIADDPACAIPPEVLPRIPAGRAGRAREVASVVLYLASDLASFVNGALVGVNGGLLL